jgi:hypothetical protein
MLPAPHGVGGEAEVEERCLVEEALALGGAQALPLGGATEERVERGPRRGRPAIVVEEAHAGTRQQAGVRSFVVETLQTAPFRVAELVADGVGQVRAEGGG